VIALAALTVGCGDAHPPTAGGNTPVLPSGGGGGPDPGPTTDAGAADTFAVEDGYPVGPYANFAGRTFAPLTFPGYAEGSTTWGTLATRDWFDPDGSKGIKGIVIIAAAQWCAVCQSEAHWVPKAYVDTYKARGARFLTVMIQDAKYAPATKIVADQWRDAFSIPFAIGIDPKLTTIPPDVGAVKLPYTYVIDPRTMKIEQVYSAAIAPSTIPALETVLARNGG
jgi:hypothetical protein